MALGKCLMVSAVLVLSVSVLIYVPGFSPLRDRLIDLIEVDYFVADSVLNYIRHPPSPSRCPDGHRLFTKAELSKYDGSEGSAGVYLSILGKVYDVAKGARVYGPGGSYHFFAAKDGTAAFVSGDFTEKGLIEDISGLDFHQYLSIDDWVQFYDRDYTYVGKLVGHFYNTHGEPTAHLQQYHIDLEKAVKEKKAEGDDHARFPSCNSEWAQGKGGRIWCSENSGGIERSWAGLPRRYFKPGATSYRCACVKNFGPPTEKPDSTDHKNVGDLDSPVFRLYPNCDADSVSCPLPNDKS